ncbi:xanthine dehydrogenase family protein molybdopterin-binding subunit [Desulfovibrio litoralis]|uniref:Xanthine dehydrogenase, molybdenum binding subunit apoprotein n=1 Tax=Desulfovibrio litoralis DSM 11393 TaxID=1121455 RepID=A0A1M7TJ02_9BACT|nr:molybdopterin cofactor-binding domain-containing protein [Desulfovibrio litoralis]SHN70739.1 xanthine dehydrogenase, molybdenum binding subunit apoprotein [Desulfovibrio litoralis DSM 11393]
MKKQQYSQIGKSVPRRDGVDKVTGRGLFTSDIYLPGMLFTKILRSPHAHARIVSIDTTEALAMPGVRAIATHENTSKILYNSSAAMFTSVPGMERILDQRIFDPIVRYVGDEVAAVAADTPEQAEAAMQLIKVEYEILPHVLDPFEALKKTAPEMHPGKYATPEKYNVPGEITRMYWGVTPGNDEAQKEIDAALAKCDIVLEDTFTVPIVKQVQLETMCAVAKIEGDGGVTVWSTTQTPHPTRFILAHIFDLPASKMRVLAPPHLGGGFGVRIGLSAKAEPIAVALAQLSGRPVRVEFTREEDFTATDTRHGGTVSVRLGAMKDGTFKALDLNILLATGAYCTFGVELPAVAGAMALAIYDMPYKRYIGHSAYTNQTTAGAMRGFGNPQSNFALEQMVDRMAAKLKMDPLVLRKKNIMKADAPWFLPYPCSSSELEACIDKGAKSIGWDKRNTFDNSGTIKRGIGMAVGTHVSNAWPFCVDFDNAYLTVQVDGSLHLAAGVPDMGTGTSTSLPQVAAEAFGADVNDIYFSYGDTATTPFTIGSHASRALYAMGTAVKQAAEDARNQIIEYTAALLNKKPKALNIVNKAIEIDGQKTPVSTDDAVKGKAGAIPLADLCYYAHIRNKQFIGLGRIVPPNSPPWHACFVDLSVDTETGMVTINKIAASHDVGFAINPMIVEGQIEGGVVQGIGYALTEEITYNASGRQNHRNMHSYMVPTINDIPPIDSIIVTSKDPQGPYGAKGAGECSLVCPASAIANAVTNAIGKQMPALPMTPERILKALRN